MDGRWVRQAAKTANAGVQASLSWQSAVLRLGLPMLPRRGIHPLRQTQMARDVVEGVERLDQALKRRDPAEVVQPMIQRLAERVKDVAVAVDRMGEIQ